MEREVLNLVETYDSIIVARHKNPDLDAYGAQFGLFYALKNKYPEKNIYVVGDDNNLNFFESLSEVDIAERKKSLVFILDTVAKQMLNEIDYLNYDKLILVDHHQNLPDIDYDYYIRNTDASSTAEMIFTLLMKWNIEVNKSSARALYMGIIGDTGRFMYSSTTARTLSIAGKLLNKDIDINEIHNLIYLENLENKKIKNIFFNSIEITEKNVAYRKNNQDFLDKYNLSPSFVSRGLIGQMAGIKEIPIWANFTYDKQIGKIVCEFRSRDYPVLEIAKKYGGGGHLYACGCSVNEWEEVDRIIEDLNGLIKGDENK
ncbi:MAG: bifunctional oligoribonuclease/PAP phosphatase NrnA [Candidatus Izemoplasmatales bacterium]